MEKHLLQDRGVVLHYGILGQIADLNIGIPLHPPLIRPDPAGQDLQKGGLSRAVDADDADLVSLVQIKIDILQQLPAAEVDGKMFRRY